jgi:CBS domain-containing protein
MDLLRGQQVIEIAADASLTKGCEQLVSHGISSAPVYSAVSKSYVGMLDYRDLVSFVLVAFHERHLERISEDPAASSTPSKPSPNSVIDATLIRKVLTGGLENVQSRQVADLSHRNPFLSVNQDSPLSYAIDILGKNGVHRLSVLGADKRVVGVLSQTDILRFIADERQPFADLMSKRLEDVVGVINRKPLSVRSESTVLRAMELMNQENVSSIAVVDAFGGLVGNVSMADIRFIFR